MWCCCSWWWCVLGWIFFYSLRSAAAADAECSDSWNISPSASVTGSGRRCLSVSMSETGRPDQLFTHLISLRDKASFDTDSSYAGPRTRNTTRLIYSSLCVCVQTHRANTELRPESPTLWAGFVWGHRLTNAAGRWLLDSWWSKVPFLSVPSFGWLFSSQASSASLCLLASSSSSSLLSAERINLQFMLEVCRSGLCFPRNTDLRTVPVFLRKPPQVWGWMLTAPSSHMCVCV